MDNVMRGHSILGKFKVSKKRNQFITNLAEAVLHSEYVIREIKTHDDSMKSFLFTLGCYEGETIAVISKLSGNYIIAVNGGRYSIDENLAKVILI